MQKKQTSGLGRLLLISFIFGGLLFLNLKAIAKAQGEKNLKSKLYSSGLTLASKGKTQYVIIKPKNTSGLENRAVKVLAESLKKITGAEFSIQVEGESFVKKAIYVGTTDFAKKQGINLAKFGPEEWLIRVVGQNLIISGGKPRGTEYGVYQFLERQAGMYIIAAEDWVEVIPDKPTFKIPALNEQGKPAFYHHSVYSPRNFKSDESAKKRHYKFVQWNRESGLGSHDRGASKNHTFARYISVKEFAKTHPEYLGMNKKGQWMTDSRGHNSAFFQLCPTNPEVRNIVTERLLKTIKKRKKESSNADNFPQWIIDLSQNDCTDGLCACPNCKKVAAREGGQAGLLLDFINDIASRVEKKYPDVVIQTFAYNFTLDIPKKIRPRKNVMMRWCDNYGMAECLRPFTHPQNKKLRDSFDAWCNISEHIAFWDYLWFRKPHPPGFYVPSSNIYTLQPDLKYLRDNKVKNLFLENEDFGRGGKAPTDGYLFDDISSFGDLRIWLAYQLVNDPDQAVEPLLKVFFDAYYGPAAKNMREYMDYMEKRQQECPLRIIDMDRIDLHKAYLDLAFFEKVVPLFDAAEKACKNNPTFLTRVAHERIPVDSALLWLEPSLQKTGRPFPFNRKKILAKYEKNWELWIQSTFSTEAQKDLRPFIASRIEMLKSTQNRAAKYLKLKPLTAKPHLDGVIQGDKAWKNAATVSLALANGMGAPRMATDVKIGIKGDTLYVAFKCTEDRLDKLTANARKQGVKEVWKDDCVEIFIDPGVTRKQFRQVIVNSLGIVEVGGTDKQWNPKIIAKTFIDKELRKWTAEIAIPIENLNLSPRFGLNFGRERRPKGAPEEFSTWSVTDGGFCNPPQFGLATTDGTIPLLTFNKPADSRALTNESQAKTKHQFNKNNNKGTLQVMIPKAENLWPGVKLHAGQADWSSFRAVQFDVFLEGNEVRRLGLRMDTEKSNPCYQVAILKPGWNRNLEFKLTKLGAKANLERIKSLYFYMSKPKKSATFQLDDIRLVLP